MSCFARLPSASHPGRASGALGSVVALDSNWVLTAAHVVDDTESPPVVLIMGDPNPDTNAEGIYIYIDQVILHPCRPQKLILSIPKSAEHTPALFPRVAAQSIVGCINNNSPCGSTGELPRQYSTLPLAARRAGTTTRHCCRTLSRVFRSASRKPGT